MTLKELNKRCGRFAKKVHLCKRGSQCRKQYGPLSETCQVGRVKICKITGDRKHCARMASLGVLPGEEAELICPQNNAQCLLKVHGGTLSLDQDTSSNIIVQSL